MIQKIENVIQTPLQEKGFELVETQYRKESGKWVVRLFVDKVDAGQSQGQPVNLPQSEVRTHKGITLGDCGKVTEFVGDVLDASGLMEVSYVLEVSSPGINRALKNESHFARCVGQKVKISLYAPLAPQSNQRNFSGQLLECADGKLSVEDIVSGRVQIPISAIYKAHLDLI